MHLKIALIFGLFFLIAIVIVIGYSSYSKKLEQLAFVREIPSFELINSYKQIVNLDELVEDRITVLIYFNSSCPICQSEAELLVEHFSGDSSLNFMFVSSEPVAQVAKFQESYKLNQLPNHSVASDTLYQLANHFKLTSVPATIVYDRNGELVEFFKGAVSISALKSAIQKAHDSAR